MNAFWVLSSIGAPALSALSIQRAFRPWPDRATAINACIVLWTTLLLVPVHVLAGLEIVGILETLSVQRIAVAQLLLLALILALLHRFGPGHPPATPRGAEPVPRFLLWSLAAIVASYAIFALDVATSYPEGFDAVAYHLPLAVRWIQEGSLQIPASGTWQLALPANAEVPMMLFLAANWQSWATIFNMVAGVLLAIGAFALGRRVGLSAPAALASTLILLTIPIVQFQFFRAYVDLFATAFFIAALSLLLVGQEVQARSLWLFLVLAGLACGIAIGSKPVFLFYGGLFGLAGLYVIFRRTTRDPRRRAFVATAFVLAILAPCSFWLWRAFLSTGNPLYPLEVSILGYELLPGLAPTEITPPEYVQNFARGPAEWLFFPWLERKSTGYPYSHSTGLGASFATFVPIGLLFSAYSSGVSRTAPTRLRYLLIGIAILAIGWWTLLERLPRFGLPILALACVGAGWLLELFLQRRYRPLGYLFMVSVVTACAISTSVPLIAMTGRFVTGRWARSAQYKIPELIDGLPAGTRLLHVGDTSNRNFALLGKDLQIELVSDFEAPETLSREFLEIEGIDFVATRGLRGEPALATILPQLELVHDDADDVDISVENRWRVWRVVTSRGNSSS
jgi:4-amino-4-deoxy-L-arabinose transferase-like glycosyltransferase